MSDSAEQYHPWATYLDACMEARSRGDRKVGTEHLVLALVGDPELADTLGCNADTVRESLERMDRDALAAVGMEAIPEVPEIPTPARASRPSRPTLRMVLKDRVPLTPAAKSALQASSGGRRRSSGNFAPEHVLGALLELRRPDPAAELFASLDVDRAAVRRRLADSISRRGR